MTSPITFSMCKASSLQIAQHLTQANVQFAPPLKSRVDITIYAEKIFQNATRLEAWEGNLLIGLVAVYCNDPDGLVAYITNVSVLVGWTGKGLGLNLLQRSVAHVRTLGIPCMQLEVARANAVAIHLYEKVGFCTRATNGSMITMARAID